MNRLLELLRQHVVCVMLFLFFLIVGTIAYFAGGKENEIVSHLSLASAIVSIVLAVVVIVYMFFQHSQSERNIAQMSYSLAEMRNLISDVPRMMRETTLAITQKASAMDETSRTLIKKFEPFAEIRGSGEPLGKWQFQFDASLCASPITMALFYCIAVAHEEHKPVHFRNIAAVLIRANMFWGEWDMLRHWVIGQVDTLKCFLEPGSISNPEETGSDWQVNIWKLPDGFKEHVIASLYKMRDPEDIYDESGVTFRDTIESIEKEIKEAPILPTISQLPRSSESDASS